LAGAEGGAARPDNALRGAFGGGALPLMTQQSLSAAPSDKEDKDDADAPTVSQKKKQAKKSGKERRDAAYGQDESQKEEHAEKQEDTRTEATAVSEKKKTENGLEGTEERAANVPKWNEKQVRNFLTSSFNDLNSVRQYIDEVCKGKLAKKSFISCILFLCRGDGIRARMQWFQQHVFIARVLVFRWIVRLTVFMTDFSTLGTTTNPGCPWSPGRCCLNG